MATFGEGGDLVRCTFCGKDQKTVKKLIAGPGVYICDECIALCNDIIDEELSARFAGGGTGLEVPRAELTAVARSLDQAAGALAASTPALADELRRQAARLHERLQRHDQPGQPEPPEPPDRPDN